MASTGNWTAVKAGILTMISEMTVANGFNYTWTHYNRKDIHQLADIYVSMDTPEGEENIDEGENVGNNLYRNTRIVEFYCYIKNDAAPASLDDVVEDVEDKLELALDDFKLKFNSTYNNAICSAGVTLVQYRAMEWVTSEDGETGDDRYSPIKMKVIYEFQYTQSRGIS